MSCKHSLSPCTRFNRKNPTLHLSKMHHRYCRRIIRQVFNKKKEKKEKGKRYMAKFSSKKEYFHITSKLFLKLLNILLNSIYGATKITSLQSTQISREVAELQIRASRGNAQKTKDPSQEEPAETDVSSSSVASASRYSSAGHVEEDAVGLLSDRSLELSCWCWLDRCEKHANLYVCMLSKPAPPSSHP